jgi:HB1/ASXL restriction endonuclease-like protein with HTH domain
MELTKLLSNPVGPLKTLLEGPPSPPRRRSARSSQAGQTIAVRHPRAGRIIEAIVRVLVERQEPMQAKAIHAAVETLLGESVRWASVKAALAANVAGPSPRFVRVARGCYGLRRQ